MGETHRTLSRRRFLGRGAGLVAGAALPGLWAGASFARRRAERVRLGIIGCAGQGQYNWTNLADQEIVALCDVDLSRIGAATDRFPAAQVVQDFRRILDRKDIDAVAVSTPDHWHGIIAVWALESGRHVYCEKPLGHSILECRVMAETAKRKGRVTQMGTQIHAGSNYRRVVELVQSGAIGPVRRVDVWCERKPEPRKRVRQGTPPATLDYDLWVGPAEFSPFDPATVPFHWRWWWEFGGGVLADMACHFMDLPHWALGLRAPERVRASGTLFADADNKVPVEMRVDYDYPARGTQPPVHLTWWHGTPGPRGDDGMVESTGFVNGVRFHGEKGQVIADYSRHKLLPEDRFKGFRRPDPFIPDSVGHHREWIQAIQNGGTTSCNFDYSGALAEAVNLGNVAFRTGSEVRWDAANLRAVDLPAADAYIRPTFRSPWKLLP